MRFLKMAVLLLFSFLAISSFGAEVRTLAVLDFQNNTGSTSLDYLSTGIPQMLITELSASGNLKVVERNRLEQAMKELALEQSGMVGTESAQKIGKMLGAELIIMGSYIKVGTNFRIDAHLLEVATGEVTGEKVLGSSVNDIMRLINELAGKIGNRVLNPQLAGQDSTYETGSIAITSNPDNAQIFLNNTPVGNTPISLQGIKAGTQTVSLFLNGYYMAQQVVQVKPGKIEVATITLKEIEPKKGGTLALSTKPAEALVIYDSLPLGNTPLTFPTLAEGEHMLRLEKEGFNTWEVKVTIVADKINSLHINLSPQGEFGSLAVNSEPAGAQVFLNGFSSGITPITFPQLAVGEHNLKIGAKDYLAVEQRVAVRKDEVATVSIKLEYSSEEGQARTRMLASDLRKLDYLFFGIKGKNWGEFYQPTNLAVDEEGYIFVADWLNHRVQKFDVTGSFQTNIGAKRTEYNLTDAGKNPGTFYKPTDIALGPKGEIYVCDSLNNRIQKFSSDNQFLLEWGPKETSSIGYYSGRLSEPWGICVDKDGNVYVADYRNYRVQKFSDKGVHLMTLGGKKTPNVALFKYPVDVAVDNKMNVWVVDQGTNQVLKFDPQQKLLLTIGKKKTSKEERIQPGNFVTPNGIAIDLMNSVYVADCDNNRVQIFDNEGKYIGVLGINQDNNKNFYMDSGNKPQEFKYPTGVAVDVGGNVYVADRENNRIHRFPPALIKKP